MSLDKSNNSFKAVDVLNQDLYQLMASGKLRYIYLRNNFYVERLSPEQLCLLDNPDNDISSLIEQTLKMVIDDFPEKPTITNYGPEAKVFYAKSSNLIIGVRVDDDFYPGGCNKVDLMLSRNFEIDFLKQYLESKVKEQMGIDCTVIRYSRDSVKSLKREKVEITEKTPK